MANLNMLLLGETGAGKTTFVNALINYMEYDNIETCQSTGVLVAAPMIVSAVNQYNKVESFRIESNVDEKYKGKGNTKFREYYVPYGDGRLCLLDLPALDFLSEDLVKQLKHLKEIHCICFFLKSSLSRLNSSFEYSIRQIISELDVSVVKNFIFVFTNGRSARFDPGVAKDVLKGFVESIQTKPPYVKIPLEPTNIFCVENEGITNLISLDYGIELTREIIEHSINSWNFSVDECTRLLSCVQALEPYKFVPSEKVKNLEKFFEENCKNYFVVFEANANNLEHCQILKNDMSKALSLIGDIENELENKLRCKTENTTPTSINPANQKDPYSKVVQRGSSGTGKPGWSPGTSRANSNKNFRQSKTNNTNPQNKQPQKATNFQGGNKGDNRPQLDKTCSDHTKMQHSEKPEQVEDSGVHDKMISLVYILRKQEKIIDHVDDVAKFQQKEMHNILRNFAKCAAYLEEEALCGDGFRKQLSALSNKNVFENLMVEYEKVKAMVQKENTQNLTDEDIENTRKKLEKLQHYQEVIDHIFKN